MTSIYGPLPYPLDAWVALSGNVENIEFVVVLFIGNSSKGLGGNNHKCTVLKDIFINASRAL